MFNCGDGRCIYQTWKCGKDVSLKCSSHRTHFTFFFICFSDGDYDCTNKADEENCNVTTTSNLPTVPDLMIPTCHDWMFRCKNERCVPYWWKCDGRCFDKSQRYVNNNFVQNNKGINDCGDNSDESGCSNVSPNNSTDTDFLTTIMPPVKQCETNEFTCDTGECISKPQLCDGIPDCLNGDDEKYCPEDRLCGPNSFR